MPIAKRNMIKALKAINKILLAFMFPVLLSIVLFEDE
jgi:hypothetical protein